MGSRTVAVPAQDRGGLRCDAGAAEDRRPRLGDFLRTRMLGYRHAGFRWSPVAAALSGENEGSGELEQDGRDSGTVEVGAHGRGPDGPDEGSRGGVGADARVERGGDPLDTAVLEADVEVGLLAQHALGEPRIHEGDEGALVRDAFLPAAGLAEKPAIEGGDLWDAADKIVDGMGLAGLEGVVVLREGLAEVVGRAALAATNTSSDGDGDSGRTCTLGVVSLCHRS